MKNSRPYKIIVSRSVLLHSIVVVIVISLVVAFVTCSVRLYKSRQELYVFNKYFGIVTDISPVPTGHLADPDAEYHFALRLTSNSTLVDSAEQMYFSYHPDWTLDKNIDNFNVGDMVMVFVLYHPSDFTEEDFVYPVITVINLG